MCITAVLWFVWLEILQPPPDFIYMEAEYKNATLEFHEKEIES